jgi:hypothetical protein
MGLEDISWGDSRCEERPYPPFSHWWVMVSSVDGGNIFMCKFCHRLRWYPSTLSETVRFSNLIRSHEDIDNAYQELLRKHPVAAVQVAKLSDLRYIRKFIGDDDEFRNMIIVIERAGDYLQEGEDNDQERSS